MAILKKWSAFFNRTDLTTNDNFQVVGIDLSNATPANRNQRTPITQLLRSGKNLSDVGSLNQTITNLGATTTSTPSALMRRDAGGVFSASSAFLDGATQPTLSLGVSATFNIGCVTASNQFFNGTVSGDTCIRATNTARQLLLGVGTSNAQFAVQNTIVLSNVTHRFGYIGTNRMPFINGTSDLVGSANYTVNGTGGLTITQTFTAAAGVFNGGGTAVTISGNAALCAVGASTQYAAASSASQFFTGTITGDTCIRNTNTSNFIHIGLGSATAQMVISNTLITANVGISAPSFVLGSGADASAILKINSTTQGLGNAAMTTVQKNAISSPSPGLVVYDTTLGKLCVRGAAAWETITSI